jgi:hypothetical protein
MGLSKTSAGKPRAGFAQRRAAADMILASATRLTCSDECGGAGVKLEKQ